MHPNATTRQPIRPSRAAAGLLALALLASACTSSSPDSGSTRPSTVVTTAAQIETTIEAPAANATTTTVAENPIATPPAANTGRVTGAGSGFIPLDDPVMVAASSASWLNPDDVVLGIVTSNGTAQAFPIRQMAYHHIANTTIDGEPYLVTY